MKYRIADLFCGAGGTSAGAVEAAMASQNPDVSALVDAEERIKQQLIA